MGNIEKISSIRKLKNTSDRELARLIFTGRKAAESVLFVRYKTNITKFLISKKNSVTVAEDLCQETFLIVLLKLRAEQLSNPSQLKAYLYGVAKYVHLGFLRKKDNQLSLREELDDFCHPKAVEAEYVKRSEARQLRRDIAAQPILRDKDILRRHYLFEQSKGEICSVLLLSNQHFDRVISRAKTRLIQQLQGSCSQTVKPLLDQHLR